MTLVEDNDHLRKLLRQWNEAFGAECYNDALVALSVETEKAIETKPAPAPIAIMPAPKRLITDLLVCQSYAELEEDVSTWLRSCQDTNARYNSATSMITFTGGNRLHCVVIPDRPNVELRHLWGRVYHRVIGNVPNRYRELVMSRVRPAEFTELTDTTPLTDTITNASPDSIGEPTSL